MTTTTLAVGSAWDRLGSTFLKAISDTLVMVSLTMLFAGLLGLIVGMLLYTTRRGGILQNTAIYTVLNVLVNLVRPIPFIILIVALQPVTIGVMGTSVGRDAGIFVMIVAATFTVARIVEQNLVTIDPGVIEAARAMGATPWNIITRVIIPEALGPLVLGYTFIFIAVVDMSAMVGYIGGGGLGDFAIVYGYRAFDYGVMYAAVLVIVLIVQAAQFLGNWLSRKIMRR